jgi:tetratricopeptide (TPR) repeat protein
MSTGTVSRSLGIALMLAMLGLPGATARTAQDESPAEQQYREDYERVQKIMAVTDPSRRADLLFAFLKERPGSKLGEYAQTNYLLVLEGFLKAKNFKALLPASERMIKLRPKVGESWYFYGNALRDANRLPEAMDALARCSLMRNSAARKSRDFLEFLYKQQHQGSLIGLDKVLKAAQAKLAS